MRLSRAEASWTLSESANEPYFNLVQRYVFAPYFTGTLAAGQAEGASLLGYALAVAGLAIAILAPILGSIADSGARLKPWLASVAAVAALAAGSLWFAAPGVSLWPVLAAIIFATIATELMIQFCNAFLPVITRPDRMGLLSGFSFGISQLAGIAALLLVLTLSRNPPALFADIPSATDRLAGPIAAAAIILFLAPLMLLAPDRTPTARASIARGLSDLKDTLRDAWQHRDIRLLLIGRMLVVDGTTVIFAFGAVLGAATFGWKADSLALFGIVITLFGVTGGFLAGWLDARIGAKRLLLAGILLMGFGTTLIIATDAERLVGFATGVALGDPLSTPQEQGFLVSGAFIALGAAFAISGMRTMMALLAPPAKLAAYFGLYAFVGKATAFVGPFLVGLIATATGSVRPGIGVALLFLALGFLIFLFVRPPKLRPD